LAGATDVQNAAKLTGIPAETIARWVDADGDVDQSTLERLRDLAESELTVRLASGQTRGVRDLAVVVGIMRDKVARYGRKAEPTGTTAVEVRDALEEWVIDAVVDEAHLTDDGAFDAHHDATNGLQSELLRRANDEPGQPHRPALLAWFSGKAEVPALPDLFDWATAHLSKLVMEHGDLIAAATEADGWRRNGGTSTTTSTPSVPLVSACSSSPACPPSTP